MDDPIFYTKRARDGTRILGARDGTRILGVFTNTSKKEVCRTVIFICTLFVPPFKLMIYYSDCFSDFLFFYFFFLC